MTESTKTQRQFIATSLLLLFVLLATGCTFASEVQDDVSERFRRPEVTDRFVEQDDGSTVIDDSESDENQDDEPGEGESGEGVVFIERFDPLVGQRRPNQELVDERTANILGSGQWHVEADISGARVDITAELDVELFELDDLQLVGLDLIEQDDVDVPRSNRWFRIDGDLTFSLGLTNCVPNPEVDSCSIARATDGSLIGLAELRGNRLRVVLSWRELGRGQLGAPELVVQVTDATGRKSDQTTNALRVSAEAAFVDWEFGIKVDDGPQPFTAIGASGNGQLEFARN